MSYPVLCVSLFSTGVVWNATPLVSGRSQKVIVLGLGCWLLVVESSPQWAVDSPGEVQWLVTAPSNQRGHIPSRTCAKRSRTLNHQLWLYQTTSSTLQMGMESVPEMSENLHILTQLSAREHFIEFVILYMNLKFSLMYQEVHTTIKRVF